MQPITHAMNAMTSGYAATNAKIQPHEAKRSERLYELGIGARSAAGSMTALSPERNAREHGFQMHHYRGCAGDPLMSWRFEPLSFAYFSLRQAKKSRCPPAQGER
ncbi:hypothetical protein PQR67_24940 [Paraburkholderia fungorum]|uniref:hypothetical protein n=1 Tax=Paraburkholderia fungorum TaxID=134537 RepID=UPI0038B79067